MSPTAAPPSPQEVNRKLSIHSAARSRKPPRLAGGSQVSGTESDSDSIVTPDILTSTGHFLALAGATSHPATSSMQPPLSSIAERRSGSGEDSDEDEEEEEEGGWRTAGAQDRPRESMDEGVIKSGYLWKKGERRKTWKKRWFVLRPAHLAYYKSSAEYQPLRLLELSDVHSCTQVTLKRHEHAFGIVSPVRTFYLQAKSSDEVQEWVRAIEEARQNLMSTSTQNSASNPIPIPSSTRQLASQHSHTTPSPTFLGLSQIATSSDSEEASSHMQPSYSVSSRDRPPEPSSPVKGNASKDTGKVVLSGYLMKCGSKRRNWRKRWFVLTGEKLVYSGSHMDTKPHRQFSFAQILDALEYDLPRHKQGGVHGPSVAASPPSSMAGSEPDESQRAHTFKIITTKRSLLLCAPTEEDEIKWLGAVRALIARRSGSGAIAGENPSKALAISQSAEAPIHVSGGGNAGNAGFKSKSRRLSAAASLGLPGGNIAAEDAQGNT